MGFFITLEGGEGAGKSTQSRLLSERLGNCLQTREPGGTKAAEWLRAFILDGKAKAWGNECEAVLFAIARFSHMRDKIIPALANKHVICDRFIDSTRVYQSGVETRLLDALENSACGQYLPNITLLIDVPANIGLARAEARAQKKDRFESENLEFHENLRKKFLALAQKQPRFAVIDGTQNHDKVHEDIWNIVQQRLFS